MKITIRKTESKGFCVDFRPAGGSRIRRFFPLKSDAQAFASSLSADQRRGGESWIAATGSERSELIAILEFCRTSNLRPMAILDGYRSGSAFPLASAIPSVSLESACLSFISAKRLSGKSPTYLEKFSSFLSGFSSGRPTLPLSSITSQTLADYLAPRKLAPVSRNSYLKRFNAFFAWHLKQGNLLSNPTTKLDRATVASPTPFTLSVSQAESALRFTQFNHPEALSTLVSLLLVGLRPAEASRVTPDMFRLDAASMHLAGIATKTGRARSIQLQPSTIAWFRACPSLVPLDNVARPKFMQSLSRHLGFPRWPQDCLRHTAASFLLALLRSTDQVALLLGNSSDILQRHYIDAVTPADCSAFWSIFPA